jgi:hypothetical protein
MQFPPLLLIQELNMFQDPLRTNQIIGILIILLAFFPLRLFLPFEEGILNFNYNFLRLYSLNSFRKIDRSSFMF